MAYRLRLVLPIVALVLAVSAGDASADRKVFLNGIDLQNVELANQKFEGCVVKFDAEGHVHITAPGFEIKKREIGTTATDRKSVGVAQPATLTKRYFVANKGMRAGKVQFEFAVYVNGKRVRTIRPGEPDGVFEITKYLKAGDNAIKLVAKKDLGSANKRRSFSPKDEVTILVGEGTVDKGVVTLRRTVLHFERNASESGTFSDSKRFRTR